MCIQYSGLRCLSSGALAFAALRASVFWFDNLPDEGRALDQELIAYLDERFRETTEQISSLREETTQRFERLEGRMDERFRHNGIEIEALRGDIRQVAEGVAVANERLDSFRQEVAAEFKDVRASIRAPFENLDGRVRILETRVLGKTLRKGKSRPPS